MTDLHGLIINWVDPDSEEDEPSSQGPSFSDSGSSPPASSTAGDQPVAGRVRVLVDDCALLVRRRVPACVLGCVAHVCEA